MHVGCLQVMLWAGNVLVPTWDADLMCVGLRRAICGSNAVRHRHAACLLGCLFKLPSFSLLLVACRVPCSVLSRSAAASCSMQRSWTQLLCGIANVSSVLQTCSTKVCGRVMGGTQRTGGARIPPAASGCRCASMDPQSTDRHTKTHRHDLGVRLNGFVGIQDVTPVACTAGWPTTLQGRTAVGGRLQPRLSTRLDTWASSPPTRSMRPQQPAQS
jgi:hypothetical protein